MLVVERNSDGRTIVRLHKDWHPGRISCDYKAYAPQKLSVDAEKIQARYIDDWVKASRAKRMAVSSARRSEAATQTTPDH